jgi:hypothetical protein
MSRSIRPSTRSIGILGAIAIAALFGPSATVHAAAIWSADAAVINAANPGAALPIGSIGTIVGNGFLSSNFAGGLTVAGGNSYSFAGTFTEAVGANTALMVVSNFTITAAATNIGTISDTMWFFSDFFHPLTPQQGFVGMGGAFISPLGVGGYTQAQMNYNGTFVGQPATAFLTTAAAYNNPLAFATPFTRVTSGFIPVSTTELTGLLAFTLNPGQSLTFPFDFSDNVNVASIVPEPSSVLLLGLGMIPLGVMARRRMSPKKAPAADPSRVAAASA